MLDLIFSDETSMSTGLDVYIKEKIGKANKIMLAGCISLPSAAELIQKLQSQGFMGELDIYDISGAPLELIKAYKEANYWKDITINLRQKDLFGNSLGNDRSFDPSGPEDSEYDFIFCDVLGHYLPDDQMDQLPILKYALAESGLIFLRDMAEDGTIESEKRGLRKSGQTFEQAELDFKEWLNEKFGFSIPLENIQNMRANLFSIEPPHGFRQRHLSAWYEHLFVAQSGLQINYKALTIPSSYVDDNRIFPMYVFGSTSGEPKFDFVYNPNGASFAQAA